MKKALTPEASLPSPGQLERDIRRLCRDALAIYPMYRRLHAMGLEPQRGETVHVSGGGENDTPAHLAAESVYAASRRHYARWVASELGAVLRRLDRVRQGLEQNVGPTAGFRQPETAAPGILGLSSEDFHMARAKQAERLRAGQE